MKLHLVLAFSALALATTCVSTEAQLALSANDGKQPLLGTVPTSHTSDNVAVIDLLNGRTLLSLPVMESDPLLNCSLSQDGRKFALLRGLNLSLFNLPG